MSKGNLSNTKVRSQLRKNRNDKGNNFYVSKNVSFNPASNLLTYEVEGKVKTATLSQEAAKNYMQYFRRCTNGYALDYLVKHQFKLNESTYRVLKLSTRFSTPAEIGEYIKSIEQKFTSLERRCSQSRIAAVKFVHSVVSSSFEKQSNSKISIVHDLFFPDITDIVSTTGLVGGKEVKVFASPYVDCVNYTTYVDNDYRTDKLIKVEFKGGNNVSYDYFPALVCQNLYNKSKGQEKNRRNMIVNQIRGIIIASKDEVKKNIANSTFFPYTADSYFKADINSVYHINPSDEALSQEVNMDMLFETMNYSPAFRWFTETSDYDKDNKYEGKSVAEIYRLNYQNNLYFSNYELGSAKLKALSTAIFYTINTFKDGRGFYDIDKFMEKLNGLEIPSISPETKRAINYCISNKLSYNLKDPIEKRDILDLLFEDSYRFGIKEPTNATIATSFCVGDKKMVDKINEIFVTPDFDVGITISADNNPAIYGIDGLLIKNSDTYNKALVLFDTWFKKISTESEDSEESQSTQTAATQEPNKEVKEEAKEEEKSAPDKDNEQQKEQPPQPEGENKSGLSKRKLKKMGLSKRQIKKIMRIVDKPKGGVTENDTLNEIKELLKVMVGQVKPSAVNAGDKPVDKLMTTNVKKPTTPTTQFNPSDILGQREKLRPTTTVKYEPPKEFNLKSEIESFDKDKLNKTMQGLAKVLKKGDITKQQSIIKKFKINPITAHLIKMVGTNQNAKKYMGGVFSKLAALLPYGSQIYEVAKRVYNVAKPVVEKVISKYDAAYDKKMNGYLSKNQLKSYLIKNEKPKLKTLNKILK